MTHRDTEHSHPPAIFLMGPTASGKTDLAIQLCQELPCEIISVDSALIYKGMDIGTAKPNKEELARAPHRLIDIIDPAQSYSVAEFRRDALAAMQDISDRGNIPLLVGGTMMYYKALVDGLSELPPSDNAVRQEIELQAQTQGWQSLHDKLKKIDSVSAARIHPNDPQRLTRALEVFMITGKTLTELTEKRSNPVPFSVKQFTISPADRSVLHDRIEQRFKNMVAQGFQQEVEILRNRNDLHLDLPSIRCVGYRQMWQHLDGLYDHNEMVYKGIVATRQLAKRQLTWLRSWKNLHWLDSSSKENLTKVVKVINIKP